MSKFKKRLFTTFALTGSLLLAACGNNGGDSSNANGDVTLQYMIWDVNQEDGMVAAAEAFEDKNPGIKIDIQVTPWDQYWTKLEAASGGGSAPDMFWMHSMEFSKYSDAGLLMNLDELVAESDSLDPSEFPDELIELYSAEDGSMYGIPKDYDTIALWYNKELFDNAGIDYPDDTWTWDDVLENAKELTDPEAGVYGFLAPKQGQSGYYNLVFSNGGYILSEDKTQSGYRDQNTIDAVQWWADLSLVHNVSPTEEQFAEDNIDMFFQAGRGAMGLFGSWSVPNMALNEYTNENTDIAPLPMGDTRTTVFNGLANSIYEGTDHPEEALKFLEFLSSEEGMTIQGKEGGAIPALRGADQSFVEAYPQFNTQVYINQMEDRAINPYSKYSASWEAVEQGELVRVFSGDVSVEEISDTIASQVEDVLADE